MNNIYNQYTPPAGDGGLFFKFEDGVKTKLRIATEPYVFNNAFTDKMSGETTISTKYAWAVWIESIKKAQVLQLPISGFRAVQELATDPEWGDPTGYDITVSRSKATGKYEYTINPSPNRAVLTLEAKEALAKVDVSRAIKGGAIPLSQVIGGKEVPPAVKSPTWDADGDGAISSLTHAEPPAEDGDITADGQVVGA